MKRLVLELDDTISDVVSITAIGTSLVGSRQEIFVKAMAFELKEDITTVTMKYEEREE